MSYDVSLEIDTGAGKTFGCPVFNYTSNVSAIWRLALRGTGFDGLGAMDGRRAGDCLPAITTAISNMEINRSTYEEMQPANGWGNAAGALDALQILRRYCSDHPGTIIRIDK